METEPGVMENDEAIYHDNKLFALRALIPVRLLCSPGTPDGAGAVPHRGNRRETRPAARAVGRALWHRRIAFGLRDRPASAGISAVAARSLHRLFRAGSGSDPSDPLHYRGRDLAAFNRDAPRIGIPVRGSGGIAAGVHPEGDGCAAGAGFVPRAGRLLCPLPPRCHRCGGRASDVPQ